MKHLKHACTPAPRLLWCCRSAARTTLTVLAYRLWHEPSVLLRGSFHQRSIKQTVTVSNWDLYSAEPEWFMHLSFLICWNKVSTFGFFFFFFCCMHQPSLRRWRGKDGGKRPWRAQQSQPGNLFQARLFSQVCCCECAVVEDNRIRRVYMSTLLLFWMHNMLLLGAFWSSGWRSFSCIFL